MTALRRSTLGIFIFVSFLIAGCATEGEVALEAAPAANEGPEMEAAVTVVNGVEVTVDPAAWSGDPGITEDVTPLQVTIQNGSGEPLAVRYSNFALISPEGIVYTALPPFEIRGTVDKAELAGAYGTLEPAFYYEGFAVAPVYDPLYDFGVYDESLFYDVGYYETYYDYWDNLALPTEHMLEVALPEGVIMPGGRVQGFIYFQKVDPALVERVRFRADLVNPAAGVWFGEISIPFLVEDA